MWEVENKDKPDKLTIVPTMDELVKATLTFKRFYNMKAIQKTDD